MVEFAPHQLMLKNASGVKMIQKFATTHFALVNLGLIAPLATTLLMQKAAGLHPTRLQVAIGMVKIALLISAKLINQLTQLKTHQQLLEVELLYGELTNGPYHALTLKFKT